MSKRGNRQNCLPPQTRRPPRESFLPAIFRHASKERLTGTTILGVDQKGDLYFASECVDHHAVLGQLVQAMVKVASEI